MRRAIKKGVQNQLLHVSYHVPADIEEEFRKLTEQKGFNKWNKTIDYCVRKVLTAVKRLEKTKKYADACDHNVLGKCELKNRQECTHNRTHYCSSLEVKDV